MPRTANEVRPSGQVRDRRGAAFRELINEHSGAPHRMRPTVARDHPRSTLSIPEAAWELGICTETAYRQAKRGDLPGAFKFGRRWLVSRDAFERWLASR